jgi:hypothetical protein
MTVQSECTDGFVGCYWNRPERHLGAVVPACDLLRVGGLRRAAAPCQPARGPLTQQ